MVRSWQELRYATEFVVEQGFGVWPFAYRGLFHMQVLTTSESNLGLSRALQQMHVALEILDGVHASGDIASHLDLAICRLEQALGTGPHAPTSVQVMISKLEKELADCPSAPESRANPWEL